MRINPIQQNQSSANANFKGIITPEVTRFFQNCARDEAKNYVLCLGKGVKADKEVLLKIKKAWSAILNKLNKKVTQMHPNTNMILSKYKGNFTGSIYYNLKFTNENLNAAYSSKTIDEETTKLPHPILSEEIKKYVDSIKPDEMDEKILKCAIENLERDLENDNLSTYSTKYPEIIKYQNQLKNVSKEEAKNNVARLNKAIDDAKAKRAERIRIETIAQENLELLDEIFGADKDL